MFVSLLHFFLLPHLTDAIFSSTMKFKLISAIMRRFPRQAFLTLLLTDCSFFLITALLQKPSVVVKILTAQVLGSGGRGASSFCIQTT